MQLIDLCEVDGYKGSDSAADDLVKGKRLNKMSHSMNGVGM